MDIDGTLIMQRKIEPIIYVYIMIIIVIMLSLIIFLILFHYKTYYFVSGTILKENDYYYIRVFIPLDDVKYIVNGKMVIIDDEIYDYEVFSIDSEYFTDNVTTYQIIKLKVQLKDNYKYENLTLKLKFIKENKRIIDYIIK